MRDAGPLFRDARVSPEAFRQHVVAMVRPAEETDRERLARDFEDFEARAPWVDVLEVTEEVCDGQLLRRAVLACGHTQGAGSSGRYRQIRCGACYAVLKLETRSEGGF